MSDRRFDARVDATPAVANGWLRPGELLDWTCARGRPQYEVKGRKPNGKPRAHLALRILGWTLASPVMLIIVLVTMFTEETSINDWDEAPDGVRSVIVTGSRTDCLAARLVDVEAASSFWVLTDRRFAFVAAEPAPEHPNMVRLRTVWELASDQYAYYPPTNGKWYQAGVAARVVLRDSSSLTFPRVPGR